MSSEQVEPGKKRRSSLPWILGIVAALVVGAGGGLGIAWGMGAFGSNEDPAPEAAVELEETPAHTDTDEEAPTESDSDDASTSKSDGSTSGSSNDTRTTVDGLTGTTALDVCIDAASADAVKVDWDDPRSIKKIQGEVWFMKSPVVDSHQWAKCKVGGGEKSPKLFYFGAH